MFTDRSTTLPSTDTPIPTDFAYIPLYDVSAGAGNGRAVTSEDMTGHFAVDRRWFHEIGLDPKQCTMLQSHGNSMVPTIAEGSPMIIDMSVTELLDGMIYVINLHGDLLVKRVQRLMDGSFELTSDNAFYKPMKIDQSGNENVHIIGRVRFVLQPY